MKRTKHDDSLTFEKVWKMFQETDKKFQETDKKFQETAKRFEETDRKIQETDRILSERFKELERLFREKDKKIRDLETKFFGMWGKLIESLVEGSLVRLFRERGIEVSGTTQRRYKIWQGKEYEIDIVVEDGEVVIPVEVKTSLSVRDVDEFVEKLKVFREVFPEYRGCKVYGAIAFLHGRKDTTMYAYRRGLYVIKATGDSAVILNDETFKPKNF